MSLTVESNVIMGFRAMPFSLTLRPPIVFASWSGGFTVTDLRDVTDHIAEMRRKSKQGVVYLSRIPAGAHVFTDDEQKVLHGFLVAILPNCASIHHVVEGDGFVRSARLGIVSHMASQTPRARDFYVHATLDDARKSIKSLAGVDLGPEVARVAEASNASPPPERASGAFREAARIVEGLRPPRKL